jgi:hypothetical protein
MASSDLKVRIHKIIDNIPDESLKELLPVLEEIEGHAVNERQVEIAKRIIAENKSLLQKLAQ